LVSSEGRRKERQVIDKLDSLKDLTDLNYIEWAKIDEWSSFQAVCLVHGCILPNGGFSETDLVARFPDSQWYLKLLKNLQHRNTLRQDDQIKREMELAFPRTPASWVHQLAGSDVAVTETWTAIFPMSFLESLESIWGREPDYRRFIYVLMHDTPTPLGELVAFALTIGTNDLLDPPKEYGVVLSDVHSRLGKAARDIDSLPGKLVNPRQFIHCYPKESTDIDDRCMHWHEWLNIHGAIGDWLKGVGAGKSVSKPKTKPGKAIEEAYGLIVRSYVADKSKGIPQRELCGLESKIKELGNNFLESSEMTIGDKWPDSSTLRSYISKQFGNPKKNPDVVNAKAPQNKFNLL